MFKNKILIINEFINKIINKKYWFSNYLKISAKEYYESITTQIRK